MDGALGGGAMPWKDPEQGSSGQDIWTNGKELDSLGQEGWWMGVKRGIEEKVV